MDFAEQQRKPGKHLVAFSVVVVFHVLLGYALVNGLARKIVEVNCIAALSWTQQAHLAWPAHRARHCCPLAVQPAHRMSFAGQPGPDAPARTSTVCR